MVTIAVGQGARHRGVAAQREKVLLHASRVGPPADSPACRSSASAGLELAGDAPGPGRALVDQSGVALDQVRAFRQPIDRKSTRLNSSHVAISYAVFCLKKKISIT